MNFAIKKEILEVFDKKEFFWVTEISEILWKNRVVIQRYLKSLVEEWILEKVEKWPKTKYKKIFKNWEKKFFNDEKKFSDNKKILNLNFKEQKILEENFWKFSPDWNILKWVSWFQKWCFWRKLNPEKKFEDFLKIFNSIENIQDKCWLLNAKSWFWSHFEKVCLDEVFYSDQYIWWEFWKWKLAEKTFYAKISQNKKLISESIQEIILKLQCIIVKENFDAIAITPRSIDRKNQLLDFLQKELKKFWLPFVKIVKYYPSWIPVPQKSLKKTGERIQNARNTIFVDDKNCKKYKKVFLIDDFVWSWSTLNETAFKLKEEWVNFVTWFAFVWNLDLKYDVINEV